MQLRPIFGMSDGFPNAPMSLVGAFQIRDVFGDIFVNASVCRRVVQYNGIGIERVYTAIRRACERAGVTYGIKRGITFHTLRHTMNTETARMGLPPKTRQLLSGHTTMVMTDHYTHMAATDKREPLELVAQHTEQALQKSLPKSLPKPLSFLRDR